MDVMEAVAIGAAGVAAGGMNAVVGSGTLITFPTLLAFGYPPVLANVSNNVGLVPGVLSAAYGYRRELRGQRRRLIRFGAASLLGGLVGALLLLRLPDAAFRRIVPVLILTACVLVLVQPRLNRWMKARQDQRGAARTDGGVPMWLGVLGTGVYGGYFGAAQGVLLMGMFGAVLRDDLQRLNAAKNVLASLVNGIAAVVFIAVADVDWAVAALIAAGSTAGGLLGARVGRRLPPTALRAVIVTVGVTASALLIARS
ncbi:sulfite exporter TauE/SafE family protein [Streptomyces sp. HUAS MG91]|uniref:Probable membrane transporter protein n=1 Tax=Streptomyces tabacisoli TaxID=3156398 RepID=A0AAU8IV43_9ACTN